MSAYKELLRKTVYERLVRKIYDIADADHRKVCSYHCFTLEDVRERLASEICGGDRVLGTKPLFAWFHLDEFVAEAVEKILRAVD